MDKFYLMENPMVEQDGSTIYIFHTQNPPMVLQIHHEAVVANSDKQYITGNYLAKDGTIETVTLMVKKIYTPETTEDLHERAEKILNKAWHWYTAYLKWEDEQIDNL